MSFADNDWVYSTDNGKIMSGGFSIESMAFKNGISPMTRTGGGSADGITTQHNNLVVPSFLSYQMVAGDKELDKLLSHKTNIIEEDDDDETSDDLYERLLRLTTVGGFKKITKRKMTKGKKTKTTGTKKIRLV